MSKINLKKLLSKSEVAGTFLDLCRLLPGRVEIVNCEEIVIYGRPGDMAPEGHPVKLEGEVLGWVKGGPETAPLASFLQYIVKRESEKRALTSEILDAYEEINVFYGMAEGLAAMLDINGIAGLIVKRAAKLMKSHDISLMLLNEKTRILEVAASFGQENNTRIKLKPGQGIAGSVLVSGRAEIINDLSRDRRFIPGNSRTISTICVPLIARKKAIGVISVSSRESREFTARDLKLIGALAAQGAAAISNARLYSELSLTFTGTVHTLVESMEKMEPGSEGHAKRVANICMGIAKMMKLSSKVIADLKIAALLHDIGKIGLQTNILQEYSNGNIIWHTKAGADILKHISQLKDVIPGVLYHHEHYSGTGLPEGRRGESIPLIARIIAVADTYDRLTEGQISGRKMLSQEAIADLTGKAPMMFDPAVVNAFAKAAAEIKGFADYVS